MGTAWIRVATLVLLTGVTVASADDYGLCLQSCALKVLVHGSIVYDVDTGKMGRAWGDSSRTPAAQRQELPRRRGGLQLVAG